MTFAYVVMSDLQKWLADEKDGQPPALYLLKLGEEILGAHACTR